MKRIGLILLSVALVVGAFFVGRGSDGRDPLIIGGEAADQGEYGFAVSLEVRDAASTPKASAVPTRGRKPPRRGAGSHFCGGSLVAPDLVVTAAHCTVYEAEEIEAVIGVSRLSEWESGVTRRVSEVLVHPEYDLAESKGPDVAVLRLAEPVGDVVPVPLIGESEEELWEPSDPAVVVGWGTTEEGGAETPDDLQEVQVEVVSDATMGSDDVYGSSFVAEHMMGAGTLEGGRDSCQGDSGGPLLVRRANAYRLVGVVSWGVGCGRVNKPGVYARVGEGTVRGFVDKVLATERSKRPPRSPADRVQSSVRGKRGP